MQIITKTYYLADDGREFETEDACRAYDSIALAVDEVDPGFVFFTGHGSRININEVRHPSHSFFDKAMYVYVVNPQKFIDYIKLVLKSKYYTSTASLLPRNKEFFAGNLYMFNGLNREWINEDEMIKGLKEDLQKAESRLNQRINMINAMKRCGEVD